MLISDLFEDAGLTFQVTVRGFHHGQMDQTLIAKKDGEYVGHIDFVEYQGEPSIQMIKVPDEQRKGYATSMVRHLQKLYPSTEISWGMMTDQGEKLYKSLPKTQIPHADVQKKVDRLESLKATEQSFHKIVDDIQSQPERTDRDQRRLDRIMDRWNDIHDEIQNLETELQGKKTHSTLIQ